jgi:hypothetical protein
LWRAARRCGEQHHDLVIAHQPVDMVDAVRFALRPIARARRALSGPRLIMSPR